MFKLGMNWVTLNTDCYTKLLYSGLIIKSRNLSKIKFV